MNIFHSKIIQGGTEQINKQHLTAIHFEKKLLHCKQCVIIYFLGLD